MDYGLVLFTSDRGITPAEAARLADEHGFTTFYVPEHTHIPVKREAAHPGTGDETLPDDRYMRRSSMTPSAWRKPLPPLTIFPAGGSVSA
jgi:alkanesulfonate monooxygenase SsuD/methylene tetrahydromethanopterin reductase-like flavin-dependent oxidoreductase (luciferase family)